MSFHKTSVCLPLLAISLFLPSCESLKDMFSGMDNKSKNESRFSDGDHVAFRNKPGWKRLVYRSSANLAKITTNNSRVRISLGEQRGMLYADKAIAMEFPVSTGKPGHETPTGDFHVMEKDLHHRSATYGVFVVGNNVVDSDADSSRSTPKGGHFVGASMPYFLRLTGSGVGMHIGNVPNYPASHGCIRVVAKAQPEVYMNCKVGTPVTIQHGPLVSYGIVSAGKATSATASSTKPGKLPSAGLNSQAASEARAALSEHSPSSQDSKPHKKSTPRKSTPKKDSDKPKASTEPETPKTEGAPAPEPKKEAAPEPKAESKPEPKPEAPAEPKPAGESKLPPGP